ncbi:hypothetical protein CLBKND_04838 [Methylorubrum aminovorans]
MRTLFRAALRNAALTVTAPSFAEAPNGGQPASRTTIRSRSW